MPLYVLVSGAFGRRNDKKQMVIHHRGDTIELTEAEAASMGSRVRPVGDPPAPDPAPPHGHPLPTAPKKQQKEKAKAKGK